MTTATTELDNLVETKGTQELTYFRALLYAAVVGAAGGLTATVYYFVLEFLPELVWETSRASIVPWFPAWLPPGTTPG
ncbi:MAG: hypothetical protein ACFB12_10640 [Leptolyngbyaceae cyanobacterium]